MRAMSSIVAGFDWALGCGRAKGARDDVIRIIILVESGVGGPLCLARSASTPSTRARRTRSLVVTAHGTARQAVATARSAAIRRVSCRRARGQPPDGVAACEPRGARAHRTWQRRRRHGRVRQLRHDQDTAVAQGPRLRRHVGSTRAGSTSTWLRQRKQRTERNRRRWRCR
jgi:hypothetical protein